MEESLRRVYFEGISSLVIGAPLLVVSLYRFHEDGTVSLDDFIRKTALGLGILGSGLLINGIYSLTTGRILFEEEEGRI